MKYPHFCGGEPTGSGLTYFFWCVFLEPHSFTILAQLFNRKWPVVDIALKSQEEPNQLWHPTQSMCGQTSWLPQNWPCFFLALSGLSENLVRPQAQTHDGLSERILKLMLSFEQRLLYQPMFHLCFVGVLVQAVMKVFLDMQCYSIKKHLNKDSKSYVCYKYQPWRKDCPLKQYPPSLFIRFGICPSFDYPGLECFSQAGDPL